MRKLKIALVAATVLGGAGLVAPAASAMPVSGLADATNQLSADVQTSPGCAAPIAAGGAQTTGATVLAAGGAPAGAGVGRRW